MTSEIDKLYDKLQKGLIKSKKRVPVTIHKGDDLDIAAHVPYGIPTGIPELDLIVRGGYPAGKVIELYGFQMCGKTTAALHATAQVQQMGGLVLWVDAERSWDDERAIQLGVKPKEVIVASADTIEATFHTMELTIDNLEEINPENKPVLLVVDSITGVPTESDTEVYLDTEPRVGQEARQIRRGMRQLVSKLAKHKATVLFINHAIAKIGGFGKQSTSGGGYAIKFFSAFRMMFIATGTLKGKFALGRFDDDIRVGQKVKIEIEKLKGSPLWEPFIDLHLRNDMGFDHNLSLLEAGVKTGWIERPTQQVYVLGEHQFKKAEWPDLIETLGGYDTLYKMWRKQAIEAGVLSPWGGAVE